MKIARQHDCKDELRNRELKVTPARLGILAALEASELPLDATTLILYLKTHNISADRVTVFRVVNTLSQKGLIKPVQFNDGKLRYEHAMRAQHHHFICEKCGKVEDISECNVKKIEKDLQKNRGLLVKRHSLEFFGICADCQR